MQYVVAVPVRFRHAGRDPASRGWEPGFPKLTNEVQHLVKVLSWESVMVMSPLKSGVSLPVYKPRGARRIGTLLRRKQHGLGIFSSRDGCCEQEPTPAPISSTGQALRATPPKTCDADYMSRRPPAPLRSSCLRQGAQECGLPTRKRPRWPRSQAARGRAARGGGRRTGPWEAHATICIIPPKRG